MACSTLPVSTALCTWGITTLVGTPVASLLIQSNQAKTGNPRSYENTSFMVGLLLVAAMAAVLWARVEAMIALEDPGHLRKKWLM